MAAELWKRFAGLPLSDEEKGIIYSRIRDANLERLQKLFPAFLSDAAVAAALKAEFTVASGIGGGLGGRRASVEWSRELVTPAAIEEVLREYKCGKLRLPTVSNRIPEFRGRPSLLHFQLESSEFSSSSALAKQVRKAMASEKHVVIAGPSGCGKTRTVLSYLSDKEGLYFTTTSELNEGSEDVQELLQQVDGRVHPRQYQLNMAMLELFTLLLLASRLVIQESCKRLGMTSYEWLLFQATCRGLVSSGESVPHIERHDVFHSLYKQLCELVPKQVQDADYLRPLSFTLREELRRRFRDIPTIAVDEAQGLVKHMASGYFRARDGSSDRPISSGFFRFLGDLTNHAVLICGTGYTLHFRQDALISPLKSAPRLPFLGVFPGWSSADEMISYAKWTIQLCPEEQELVKRSIWKDFKGRYRPFATVIETMLLENCTLCKAADIVREAYITKGGLDIITWKPGLKRSYYDIIWELIEEKPPCGSNLVNVLQRAVLNFFTRGRGIVLRMKAALIVEAVERGLGTLVMQKDFEDAVEFEELLLLKAACKVFQDWYQDTRLWEMCLENIGDDSDWGGQGTKYQYAIPLAFQRRWDEYGGKMCDMPLFRQVYANYTTPQRFKKFMENEGVYVEGDSWVYRYTDTYKTQEFLLERNGEERKCTTLLCEPAQGVDTACRLRFLGSDVDFLAQYKFLQGPLSSAAYKDAIHKADYMYNLQGAAQWRVCLVWIYPQRRPYGEAYWWNEKKLVMVIDDETAHHILDEKDLSILRGAKSAATVFRALNELEQVQCTNFQQTRVLSDV